MPLILSGFRFEPEAMLDAIDQLAQARLAAARRHGADFRALGRRVDDVFADLATSAARATFDLIPIDAECVMAVPAVRLTELLRDARALGVIL